MRHSARGLHPSAMYLTIASRVTPGSSPARTACANEKGLRGTKEEGKPDCTFRGAPPTETPRW